jgi:hypothetical protein
MGSSLVDAFKAGVLLKDSALLEQVQVMLCTYGDSEFEAYPLPLMRLRTGAHSLLTLFGGCFTFLTAKSYCEVESVVVSSIRLERQIESQSSAATWVRFESAL